MKKLYILLLVMTGTAHLYEMRQMVGLQIIGLEEIVRGYGMGYPSGQQIDAFLAQYPNGTSLQRVFSNPQKGSLCGVYAIQNSLWYRYMMGNRDHLVHSNKLFVDLLNSIDNVRGSDLNGIEAETFEKLLIPKFDSEFAIIAFQKGRYVPLNAAAMDVFDGNGVGYVSDLILNKIPVVSLLINCSRGDTYGASGYDSGAAQDSIAGHWVSVTMIQNGTKRVYLMADSLADTEDSYDEGHTGFVLQFLNEVEKELPEGKKITFVSDEIAADYQMLPNDRHDERLRKEWLHQLSPDDILVKVKKMCADKLEEKHMDGDTRYFVFENIIKPALQDLDETATAQTVVENFRMVLQGGAVDGLENAQNVYTMFDEIIALLQGDEQSLEQIRIQEKLKTYQLKLQDAFNDKFVHADDVVIVSNLGENQMVKEVIVGLILSVIEKAINVASVGSYTGACSSLEQCVDTQNLVRSICTEINQNFQLMIDMGVFIEQKELCAIVSNIVGQVQSTTEERKETRPIPAEARLVFQPIVFQTGLNRFLPRVSDFRFLQFQTVPQTVGIPTAQSPVNLVDELD